MYQLFHQLKCFFQQAVFHTAFSIDQGSVAGKAKKLQLSKSEAEKREILSEKNSIVTHIVPKGCVVLENLSCERAT